MALSDWAATAEIIGALAIVITLVYLAIQIRQNTDLQEKSVQATRVAASQAIVDSYNDYRRYIIGDPEVAKMFILGLEGLDRLDAKDKVRFGNLMATVMFSAWQHFQIQENEELIVEVNRQLFHDLFKHPGANQWFTDALHTVDPKYREFLEGVLQEVGEDRHRVGDYSCWTNSPVPDRSKL